MGHNVFCRSINAGVALAGAGVLAWAPVPALVGDQTALAAPRIVVADVVPTASSAETLAAAAMDTLRASVHAWTTEVPQLWNTVTADWIDERLTGRNYGRVAELLLLPAVPFVSGPFNRALAGVLSDQFPDHSEEIGQFFEAVEYAAIRVVGPLLSAFAGAGEAHAGIFRPMTTWDIPGFLVAVVKAPIYVIDGFLNGGYGDLGPLLGQGFDGKGDVIAPPGLFTPWGATVTPRNIDGPLPAADSTNKSGDLTVEVQPKANAAEQSPARAAAGTRNHQGAHRSASSAAKASTNGSGDERKAGTGRSARR
ncbi:hypothetical protein [Mycolicibacterium helvum]|uniref:Uncharacterized protein n=1 Tax=Mycolicibacterium helvum TaxID=1534349 RepID=A0A7I7T3L4_9MYCO|nr:hypothetical protein [Mycolicibacterium helvum]BBY63882.1 hypothetical protein MHEL_21250 [Mycolicibacterium helvum]